MARKRKRIAPKSPKVLVVGNPTNDGVWYVIARSIADSYGIKPPTK